MHTDLVVQDMDFVEEARQLSVGCDFFKELTLLYEPHAEAEFEAFRQDWLARYEKGEIELEELVRFDDSSTYWSDAQGWNMTDAKSVSEYRELCHGGVYFRAFPRCAMLPITDVHREFIVICHARGLKTETALLEMVDYFEEFAYLRQYIQVGQKSMGGVQVEVPEPTDKLSELFKVWKRAFSYLRPTHSRWPDQKYGALWRDTKAAYTQARMLEFSGTKEAVIAGLAEAVDKAQKLVASSTALNFDKHVKALVSLSTALHKILRDEEQA